MAGILIFDGECGFCRSSANWCRRRLDTRHAVTASQDFNDAELSRLGVTRDQVNAAAWWIEPGREPARGAEAIASALVAMGGTKAVIGSVLRSPVMRPLAGVTYDWVADHRPLVSRASGLIAGAGRRFGRLTRR